LYTKFGKKNDAAFSFDEKTRYEIEKLSDLEVKNLYPLEIMIKKM
jgi:hypothetical protein